MKNEIINNDALTVRVNTEPVVETVESLAQEVHDLSEEVLENIEAAADRVNTVVRNNPYILAAVGLAGLGVGAFVGYRVAVKRLTVHYDRVLEADTKATKAYYERLYKGGDFESPEKAVEALVPTETSEFAAPAAEAQRKYTGLTTEQPEEPKAVYVEKTTTERQNVFSKYTSLPTWDQQAEEVQRVIDDGQPYVISLEEWNEGRDDHGQDSMTYFEGGPAPVLADKGNMPVDEVDYLVGESNMTRFGHGSRDANIVYIRNEKVGMDFEVLRSAGSYAQEVFGADDEPVIRHSHSRRARRSRDDRE